MHNYEVEYSYPEPVFGKLMVQADHMDEVEDIALDRLSQTLNPEIQELCIESVKKVD